MCWCGGMADASDSKSDVGDYMWVQVPPPAPKTSFERTRFFYCLDTCAFHQVVEILTSFVALACCSRSAEGIRSFCKTTLILEYVKIVLVVRQYKQTILSIVCRA